jgi:hypothetical protein
MRTLRRSTTLILLATAAFVLPQDVQASATPIAISAKVCHRGTPARIGGAQKCLQVGEYCATRFEGQYERYGFECSVRYDRPRLRRD